MKKLIIFATILLTSFSSFSQENEPTDTKWRFAAGIAFIANQTADADARVTDNSLSFNESGNVEFDVDSRFALELDARYTPKNSWGFLGGISYGFDADIENFQVNVPGVTSTNQSDKIKISYLFANAVYRWNEFYLPFGINYSFFDYEESNGVDVDTDGGIGAQLGVGWLIQDRFAVELWSRAIAGDFKAQNGTTRIEYTDGIISSLVVVAKYVY